MGSAKAASTQGFPPLLSRKDSYGHTLSYSLSAIIFYQMTPFPQVPWGREEGLGPGPWLTLGPSAFSLHLCAPLFLRFHSFFLLKLVV